MFFYCEEFTQRLVLIYYLMCDLGRVAYTWGDLQLHVLA